MLLVVDRTGLLLVSVYMVFLVLLVGVSYMLVIQLVLLNRLHSFVIEIIVWDRDFIMFLWC